MLKYFIGLFLRPVSYLIPIKKKHWVFGADMGRTYREGSKYLLEYMLANHKDYTCTFITRNREVYRDLKSRNIPCEMNFSLKGIVKIMEAEYIFCCQVPTDILFTYKKRDRKYYHLIHGQPFKRAMGMLKKNYFDSIKHRTGFNRILLTAKDKLAIYLIGAYHYDEIDFVSATSEFTAHLLRKEYSNNVGIKILGMPRNDALFQPERMKCEPWIDGIEGKYVITYMPTHRKYGRGKISPILFANNQYVQEWMRKKNVVLLIKQHPNMIPSIRETFTNDVIIDITKMRIDPQVVIYHTGLLITDYSSVWMDYLLLRRPLLFYFYDNFETEDAGCYYDLREEFPQNCCSNEDMLFEKLKTAVESQQYFCPSESEINKFHRYVDGNSCERYYWSITKGH